MHHCAHATLLPDPDLRFAGATKASCPIAVAGVTYFHDQNVAERHQRLIVERLRSFVVGYREPDVVDHVTPRD